MAKLSVLLADDDEAICTVLGHALRREGYDVEHTGDFPTLMRWVSEGRGDLVITDVVMPSGNGLDHLPQMKAVRPDLPVIVISAQSTLMMAVRAAELGAYDYLPKPFDLDDLIVCVEKSLAAKKTRPGVGRAVDSESVRNLALIGTSPAMQHVYRVMARLVSNNLTVLIEGESGTGKELVARALHQLGSRKYKPFVAVNMAAIPRDLVESELFGHEKGAFTGAAIRKHGTFAQAEGGTLFLDEIGDMPPDAQSKLLRVLQQGEYMPVGGNEPLRADVRILCATHRNLPDLIAAGQFREDLYYRLNVVPIRLPALRERTEDIGALSTYFLQKAHEKGLAHKQLDEAALEVLRSHRWPGNVRELENVLYRLAALCSEAIIGADAARHELARSQATPPGTEKSGGSGLQEQLGGYLRDYFNAHTHSLPPDGLYDRMLQLLEKPLIEETLRATNGNQLRAAKILGINRNTLRKKIQQFDSFDRRRTSIRQAS